MPGMVAIDWGTTTFRAYLLENNGTIIKHVRSEAGILKVENGDFVSVLRQQLASLGGIGGGMPIIASGMITSQNGWHETPYIECPVATADLAEELRPLDVDLPGRIWFVPGVKQLDPQPDIMRGEETQLAGTMFSGESTVILPGTHSKWVTMKDDVILGFKTFMTGDVYNAVVQYTILKTLVADQWSQEMYLRGVRKGVEQHRKRESLLSGFFQLRVQSILGLIPQQGGRSYLSGLLIGTEIAEGLAAAHKNSTPIRVAGDERLTELYLAALSECNISGEAQLSDTAAHGLYRIAKYRKLL